MYREVVKVKKSECLRSFNCKIEETDDFNQNFSKFWAFGSFRQGFKGFWKKLFIFVVFFSALLGNTSRIFVFVGVVIVFIETFHISTRIILKNWIENHSKFIQEIYKKYSKYAKSSEKEEFLSQIQEILVKCEKILNIKINSKNEAIEKFVFNRLKKFEFQCKIELFLGFFGLIKVFNINRLINSKKAFMIEKYLELKIEKEYQEKPYQVFIAETLKVQNKILRVLNTLNQKDHSEESLNLKLQEFKVFLNSFLCDSKIFYNKKDDSSIADKKNKQNSKNIKENDEPKKNFFDVQEPNESENVFFIIEGQGQQKTEQKVLSTEFKSDFTNNHKLINELKLKFKIPVIDPLKHIKTQKIQPKTDFQSKILNSGLFSELLKQINK